MQPTIRTHRVLSPQEGERAIEGIRPLVKRLASRSCMRGMQEDIEQELLLQAVMLLRTYDPDGGASFLTYCYPKLVGHAVPYHKRNRYAVSASPAVISGQETMRTIVELDAVPNGYSVLPETILEPLDLDHADQIARLRRLVGTVAWSRAELVILQALLSQGETDKCTWSRAGVSATQGKLLKEQILDRLACLLSSNTDASANASASARNDANANADSKSDRGGKHGD